MKTGTLSDKAQTKLNDFRDQIDEIDKNLISLFKQRIAIVSEVSKLKKQDATLQCFIRSGRESEMLREIYKQFQDSNFHPEAACAIWRLIISASTHHESAMQIASPNHLKNAAMQYFGNFMNIENAETAQEAINLTKENPSSLIILPLWQENKTYWQEFAELAPESLKVFATIPFTGPNQKAFVAANLTPEPSSDDISIFIDQQGNIETIDGCHNSLASNDLKVHKKWLGTYGRPIETTKNGKC